MYGCPVKSSAYYTIKNYYDLLDCESELWSDLIIKDLDRFKSIPNYTANQIPGLVHPICENHTTIFTLNKQKGKK